MANLNRKEMCDSSDININTYKGWEVGRYGGLPLDGAYRVIERISKEGVVCTSEWLIYGVGAAPYVVSDFNKSQDEDSLILNEILLFKKQFPEAIDCQITDDGLAPNLLGDIVAWIKYYGNKINELLNSVCIINLASGDVVVNI